MLTTDPPSILGIDVSSFRLDGGRLDYGLHGRFDVHHEILGKPSEKLHDRLRRVAPAVRYMLGEWPAYGGDGYCHPYPDWVVIEDAYGMSGRARKALDLTVGAIMGAIPADIPVKLLKAAEWRSYLGVKNTKPTGHAAVLALIEHTNQYDPESLDEHELDALGVALGWAAHLESQTKEDLVV